MFERVGVGMVGWVTLGRDRGQKQESKVGCCVGQSAAATRRRSNYLPGTVVTAEVHSALTSLHPYIRLCSLFSLPTSKAIEHEFSIRLCHPRESGHNERRLSRLSFIPYLNRSRRTHATCPRFPSLSKKRVSRASKVRAITQRNLGK